MKILKEGVTDLYKGVFWVVNNHNFDEHDDYYYLIPCDSFGNVLDDTFVATAKSGETHNHKRLWGFYNTKLTNKYPFDYFPRGRVEINNGKAIIWVNPNLNTDKFKKFIVDKYHLYEINGINRIVMKPDYSDHYKCHLD